MIKDILVCFWDIVSFFSKNITWGRFGCYFQQVEWTMYEGMGNLIQDADFIIKQTTQLKKKIEGNFSLIRLIQKVLRVTVCPRLI